MPGEPLTRRGLLRTSAAATLATAGTAFDGLHADGARHAARAADAAAAEPPLEIGDRRELFVDDRLIGRLEGGARQRLHQPTPRELVLRHDAPWEGTGSGYHSVFQDGGRYRMYYKAWHLDVQQGRVRTDTHPLFCCYAESDDGIEWRKPELGLHEFQGSKANNIVLTSGLLDGLHVDAGHPAVFRDDNPAAPEAARFKALVRSSGPNGLLPFQSPDGIRFTPMTDGPILSGTGAFDSQNLAFWDPTARTYRAYWRYFTGGEFKGRRDIRTATSPNLVDWAEPQDLRYVDSPPEQLYTNQIKPYHRAPHLLLGFPARYVERGWSESMRALPEREHRERRASATPRYGTALTDSVFMASRDGVLFHRWNESFLRAGPERPDTWNYGHQYIAWHLVETPSHLPGAAPEVSLYASESYWTGTGSAVRRYTLRLDGFVSIEAPQAGGLLVTRPVVFTGRALELNVATSAAGSVRVELQSPDGSPVAGHTFAEADDLYGDTVARTVTWQGQHDVHQLAGRPVRLAFRLADADLYSFRFRA